jgi:hypothetical protein
MNYQELQRAKEQFPLRSLEKDYSAIYKRRAEFVRKFNRNKIASMTLDEYVIGKEKKDTFCYILERSLAQLGNFTGSTSKKFGVYYGKEEKDYVFIKKFGKSAKEAFANIKQEILALLEAGEAEDYDAMINSPISTMFKGKILSTYFPEKYLNILCEDHLDHYLRHLDLDNKDLMKQDPIYKRKALLEFKNKDADMKKWSVNMFATFLWRDYPKAPIKDENRAVHPMEREMEFPTVEDYTFVNMELVVTKGTENKKAPSSHSSVDYEKEAHKYKLLGDRGESIVVQAETKRIKEELSISIKDAKRKIKWVSRESDAYGYDILSVNKDGTPRYIEVKATSRKCGDMDFYYTANELEMAKKYGKDYYLYVVYEIMTEYPKIWIIQNPFIEKEKLELKPIKFKVKLCAKQKD